MKASLIPAGTVLCHCSYLGGSDNLNDHSAVNISDTLKRVPGSNIPIPVFVSPVRGSYAGR